MGIFNTENILENEARLLGHFCSLETEPFCNMQTDAVLLGFILDFLARSMELNSKSNCLHSVFWTLSNLMDESPSHFDDESRVEMCISKKAQVAMEITEHAIWVKICSLDLGLYKSQAMFVELT